MERTLDLNGHRRLGKTRTLDDKFFDARERLEDIRVVNFPKIDFCGNLAALNIRSDGIGYVVPLSHDTPKVAGKIGNVNGEGVYISVDDIYDVPTGDHSDEIVRHLDEAIGYVCKLNIVDDMVFLPEKRRALTPNTENEAKYEEFFKELVAISEEINVTRSGHAFGNCVALKMPSGLIIAYDPTYGKAAYVVEDIEVLSQYRSDLKESGDAIVIYRNIGGNKETKWKETLSALAN